VTSAENNFKFRCQTTIVFQLNFRLNFYSLLVSISILSKSKYTTSFKASCFHYNLEFPSYCFVTHSISINFFSDFLVCRMFLGRILYRVRQKSWLYFKHQYWLEEVTFKENLRWKWKRTCWRLFTNYVLKITCGKWPPRRATQCCTRRTTHSITDCQCFLLYVKDFSANRVL
jgi:hypothetical protein